MSQGHSVASDAPSTSSLPDGSEEKAGASGSVPPRACRCPRRARHRPARSRVRGEEGRRLQIYRSPTTTTTRAADAKQTRSPWRLERAAGRRGGAGSRSWRHRRRREPSLTSARFRGRRRAAQGAALATGQADWALEPEAAPTGQLQILSLSMAARRQAWQFAGALVFFHASEYILAAAFHGRHSVTATSLLISKQYILAMSFAMLEHLTEILLFPEVKEYWFISIIGLLMVVIGEIIRKLAVVTAGCSFTHVIRIYHDDQHQLVTHGIYRFMRHPGYSGFLLWAVGTQVMLCNPVSTVVFSLVLWRFFSKRIPYEEFFLRQFFGSEYEEYARKVHSGLPFIR